MTRHVDAETLAGFRQGDLSPRRTARVRAHLAGCARCRDLNTDLAGVTTLLAAAAPPPIPEHLAARIQTALATEAARRAGLTATGLTATGPTATGPAGASSPAAGTPETAMPETPRNGHPRRPERPAAAPNRGRRPWLSSPVALRATAGAAAAAVIAVGAYEITQHTGGPPSAASSGAAAPSKATAPRARPAGPAALGRRASNLGSALTYRYAGHTGTVTPVTSGTDYGPGTLRSQVGSQLTQSSAAANAEPDHGPLQTGSPAAQPGTFGAFSTTALQGCVNRIAAGHQVLLVDVARYLSAPAAVIVTQPSPRGPDQAWVVGTGCSAARSDVLTHLALP